MRLDETRRSETLGERRRPTSAHARRKKEAPGVLIGRVPALDGLRGIALIAVLGYHAAPDVVKGGFLGVEMFFVLSGFLLTALLLDEHERTGAIDKRAYAGRRLRRIVPALIVLLGALAVVGHFLGADDAHRLDGDILSSLAGVVNWHLISDGSSYFARVGRPPLVRHLWSIAVELQAYLVIPFIAAFVARRRRARAIAWLAGGVAASALLMAVLYDAPDPLRAYYGTDTRIGALLTGALLAVALARRNESRGPALTGRAITLMAAAGAICVAVLIAVGGQTSRLLYPAGFLAVQAATGALLFAATRPGTAATVMNDPRLRWLGTRSYGIYLWHWPIVALFRPGLDVQWPHAVVAAIGIAAAVGLGELSYRFIERPFLTRAGWARSPLPRVSWATAGAWVAVTLVLVGMLARTSTVDPIAASIAAGEKALAEQEVVLTPAPTTDATEAPVAPRKVSGRVDVQPKAKAKPAAAPGKVPADKGPKAGTVKLTAVGDSVMLGAASRLKPRLGKSAYVNAEKNRRYSDGLVAVRTFRKQRGLGRVLIVHLGNNGPPKREEIDAVVKEAKDVEHVLLVTVRVTKPWQDTVNAELRAADERHKKVKLVDWWKTSRGHPDWFYSDHTHMNGKGAEAYTKLIASAIPPLPKAKPKPTPAPKPTPKPSPTPLLPGIPD